jgi:energy-coupling factor transporter ATP-binding protein EcfA2/GNAT superfamily N-acetyltransferase
MKKIEKELKDIKDRYDVKDYIESTIKIPKKKDGLVLIVGSSGSGKSTIIKNWFKVVKSVKFDNKISVIENFKTPKIGERYLRAFGLRTIPTWFRPYKTLSNGEKHRAFCALSVSTGQPFLDEFTSVVDRNTAKSLSVAVKKFLKDKNKNLVIASCHHDIKEWLCPDHVYDTDLCRFENARYLQHPKIRIKIQASTIKDWVYFKKHHYLSSDVHRSCHFYTAYFEEKKVGFVAVIHRTSGVKSLYSFWAESRVVVIPEFQGMGIGLSISEAIAEEYTNRGFRYYSRTAHQSFGEARNKSEKWRNTLANQLKPSGYINKNREYITQQGLGKSIEQVKRDAYRICYSHEYIGNGDKSYKNIKSIPEKIKESKVKVNKSQSKLF